ncbi:MAG: DUF2508 family protein [Oscillospiraceae bacterium]|nr:DUF2508 family protein [Oscillospiraceae bacterium]
MEKTITKFFARKADIGAVSKDNILDDIKALQTRITGVSICLNMESNEELIEAYIYELKGLNIRLNFLIKNAKELV